MQVKISMIQKNSSQPEELQIFFKRKHTFKQFVTMLCLKIGRLPSMSTYSTNFLCDPDHSFLEFRVQFFHHQQITKLRKRGSAACYIYNPPVRLEQRANHSPLGRPISLTSNHSHQFVLVEQTLDVRIRTHRYSKRLPVTRVNDCISQHTI